MNELIQLPLVAVAVAVAVAVVAATVLAASTHLVGVRTRHLRPFEVEVCQLPEESAGLGDTSTAVGGDITVSMGAVMPPSAMAIAVRRDEEEV